MIRPTAMQNVRMIELNKLQAGKQRVRTDFRKRCGFVTHKPSNASRKTDASNFLYDNILFAQNCQMNYLVFVVACTIERCNVLIASIYTTSSQRKLKPPWPLSQLRMYSLHDTASYLGHCCTTSSFGTLTQTWDSLRVMNAARFCMHSRLL